MLGSVRGAEILGAAGRQEGGSLKFTGGDWELEAGASHSVVDLYLYKFFLADVWSLDW